MGRTVKQDIDLLFEIKQQVMDRLNPDFTQSEDIEQCKHYITLIFENQNKWLLSDKISAEKQSRMDQFKDNKTSGEGSGVFVPPTAKQVEFAGKLGIDIVGKSKSEVSRLIDEKRAKQPWK